MGYFGFWKSIPKVYRLNLNALDSKWERVLSMDEKRCRFGTAVYKGCLVVTGGNNGNSAISTAEMYEPCVNRWSAIGSLSKTRAQHVLVVEEEKLFVIEGSVDGDTSSSVELLDDLDAKSKETNSMNVKRKSFAAVVYDNFIYAIGGIDSGTKTTHKSVEKYDVTKSVWNFVSCMNVERRQHAACVLNGKIYVIGGIDATNTVVKTMECYDPKSDSDQWTVVGETKPGLRGHAVVAM